MPQKKKILIVEDHPIFRHGLRSILQDYPDEFNVVGEAETGRQAVAFTRQLEPDVVLMDIHIPEMDGIEATRAIYQISEETEKRIAVLMITLDDDAESVFASLRAGAKGYVLKANDMEELLLAVRVVANGGAVYGASIANRIQNYFTHLSQDEAISSRYPTLTKRESSVLGLVQKRYTNAQVAAELKMSQKTVRNHISNILNKLQVATRKELIEKGPFSSSGGGDSSKDHPDD
ncbi:MAG: response regulator [Anaerolineaceae bacterium]|nr:response regulator [Anaerolineaceae bacterium]